MKQWGIALLIGLGAYLVLRRPSIGLVYGGQMPSRRQRFGVQRTETHRHQGIDISAPKRAGVHAAGAGRVAARWPDGKVSGYGNTVVIQHPDQTQTLYAHLDSFAPGTARGSAVKRGQLIGYVGQTQLPRDAMQTPPHLHFEAHLEHSLRIGENSPVRMDPLQYLALRNVRIAA